MRPPRARAVDRRAFLLAGAAGRASVPFGRAIDRSAPGAPVYYATTLTEDGLGLGVLVETHDGRPTELGGNPLHPATLGASSAAIEAAILDLYDPDRAKEVRRDGVPVGPEALRSALAEVPDHGVHLLLAPTSSAAVAHAVAEVRARLPGVRVHTVRGPSGPLDGARLAVGRPMVRRVDLAAADVVVAIDADPLHGPEGIRHARGLADGKRRNRDRRVWVAEAGLTPFGATADERIGLRPSEVPGVLVALAAAVLGGPDWHVPAAVSAFARAAATDLRARTGVVLLGPTWPAWMHALVLAIDHRIGSLGRPVVLVDPPHEDLGPDDLPSLLAALDAGGVDTLVLATNVARAPADLRLARRLRQARRIFALAVRPDETTALADWTVPALHPLEAWGDARAPDGTRSAVQPVTRPLVPGFQVEDVLGMLAGSPRSAMERARAALAPADWARVLRLGLAEGTALPESTPPVDVQAVVAAIPPPEPVAGGLASAPPSPWSPSGTCAGCGAVQPEDLRVELEPRTRMRRLRIDRVLDGPGTTLRPVLCRYRNQVLCAYVCPEYHRCIGTRLCGATRASELRRDDSAAPRGFDRVDDRATRPRVRNLARASSRARR